MKKVLLGILFVLINVSLPLWGQERSVSLQTQDGWTLTARYLPGKTENKTVVLLHDIGKTHAAFETFTDKLAIAGIGYLSLDMRGHGGSISKGPYTSFAKEGVDNEYNKMIRDVNAAIEYLKKEGRTEQEIVLIGAGMGANVAAKAVSLWPDLSGLALITPVTNFRDVLPIPSLRVYKGLVFIAAAADDKKTFLEASVMRNVAFLSSGEGRVTFATAYDKKGHELLDSWVSAELLQWLKTPQKPEVLPDVNLSEEPEETGFVPPAASDTETILIPSVLQ